MLLADKNQLLEMFTDEELFAKKDEYTSEFLTELYLYSQLRRVVTEYQDLILFSIFLARKRLPFLTDFF